MCDKYNGWSNYETWNCKLWMDNDEGSQQYWAERAQECYDQAEEEEYFTRDEVAERVLAEELKEHFNENMPEVTGFYADILGAAVNSVNWYDIAEALLKNIS